MANAEGVAWDDFSSMYPRHRLWFFTLMDVSTDLESGWQQLALCLSLNTDEIKVSIICIIYNTVAVSI